MSTTASLLALTKSIDYTYISYMYEDQKLSRMCYQDAKRDILVLFSLYCIVIGAPFQQFFSN